MPKLKAGRKKAAQWDVPLVENKKPPYPIGPKKGFVLWSRKDLRSVNWHLCETGGKTYRLNGIMSKKIAKL
jgi:hypothetical protein